MFIDYKGLSVYAFENAIGCARGVMAKALKYDKGIQSKTIERVLRAFPEIDILWLLDGQGNMLKTGHTQIGSANRIDNSPITVHPAAPSAELERLKAENELLKAALRDKEEIIRLLKSK